MAQESEENDELFCINIGNILPHSSIIIKITYITELTININQQIQFEMKDLLKGEDGNIQGDIEALISITMHHDIQNVSTNLPNYSLKRSQTKATVSFASRDLQGYSGGADLILCVAIAEIHEPRLYIEENTSSKHKYAHLLSIYPHLTDSEADSTAYSYDKRTKQATEPQVMEYLFVIDRSASMESCFEYLKGVLTILIEQLRRLCEIPDLKYEIKFNIIGFGSSFEWVFINSEPLNLNSIREAFDFIEHQCYPDFGGSDIWLPLSSIYLLLNSSPTFVFFFALFFFLLYIFSFLFLLLFKNNLFFC